MYSQLTLHVNYFATGYIPIRSMIRCEVVTEQRQGLPLASSGGPERLTTAWSEGMRGSYPLKNLLNSEAAMSRS
ncbi:MAG: hypothetical protein QOH41_756 [Blastocatellia bacterium]|jgi:hypothetical protein|nr:hypothetical protein [Blastocatellia bacterium]